MGCLALQFRVGVAVNVLLACSDLHPISLFALLVYTYPLLLGRPKSQICLKMDVQSTQVVSSS